MNKFMRIFKKNIEEEQAKHPIMSLKKHYTIECIISVIVAVANLVLLIFNQNDVVFILATMSSIVALIYMFHIEFDFKKEITDELVQETFNLMRKGVINILCFLSLILMILTMFNNSLVIPSFSLNFNLMSFIYFTISAIWKGDFLILDKSESFEEDEE